MRRHLRILDFALANLWRRRGKTLVVVAVYALLICLLASLLFYVRGLQREARRVFAGAPEIVVQRLRGGRHELIEVDRAAAIRGIRGVGEVTPRVWGYSYDPPTAATFTFWGAESEPAGSLEITDGSLADGPRTCVVGQGVAEVRLLWLGDRLPIRGSGGELYAPRVVGIFTADSALLTNDLVVMPTPELRQIFQMPVHLATDLAVEVGNPREIDTVARKIQQAWPDVRVITRPQILRTYDAIFDWRGGLWGAMLLASIAAFAILVWDKATGLSAEEVRTIGILRAVGWSPRNVLELELWQGTIVSALAVGTGLVAAQIHLLWWGGALFRPVLEGWSVLFPDFDLGLEADAYVLAPCLLLVVVPYVAASLVPAWRAAITDPDSVIRR